jgi:putative membrane protein
MADFQDGRRFSAAENTTILQDTVTVFQNVTAKLGFLQPPQPPKKKSGSKTKKNQNSERAMNHVRLGVGLYKNFPLAHATLEGSEKREAALKESGHKQMNHVRGTDGWWRSMLVIEDRAIDNYLGPWILICANALLACLLTKVGNVRLPEETLLHLDTVYSLVLKTSLAFLLVFRLNRCAMRFWDARGLWGNLTHQTRNLVGAILLYGSHCPKHRDAAIRWGASLCVASKNFIRSDHEYPPDELAGFLSRDQVTRLSEASHGPLFAASMCRHYLSKVFFIDETTPPGLAHAYTLRLQECESYVARLVEQVSGMEKIRSTPLPIVYVTHLRTFLITYAIFLPWVWVHEWSWATVPLTAFTAFALLGIEGASSEVEIPFSKARSNHLAMDAYCLVILDSVSGLVVQDANLHMQGRKGTGHGTQLAMLMRNHSFDSDYDDEIENDNENHGAETTEGDKEKIGSNLV